jgi:tetratricopeptide (TPR) repeat protein
LTTVFDLAADHSAEHQVQQQAVAPEIDTANAHFRLAQVAAARGGDDFSAAEHMRQALDLHNHAGGQLRGATEQALRQDIDWHYLRAAKAKGDNAEVQRRLEALLAGVPLTNPDIANDLVPMLRDMGRTDEAKAMFDQVYETLQKNWNEWPGHPMPKNNLAWLCARCGERKEEALKLAEEATRAMPDNAAFVDTLAEANYQLGRYAEAARLEAKVMAARPNDRFLRTQFERFEKAAATHKGE